jgi:hypothetical protein
MKGGQRRTRRLGAIESSILEDLSAGDMLYGFLLSGRSTGRMFTLARERANYRFRRKRAIDRLVVSDYIRTRKGQFFITRLGQSKLGKAADINSASLKTKNWDKKWRVVVYGAGFQKLQQSIWIFPHDCEELVELIREESRLAPYILYGVLDRIENDEILRKKFKMKK